MACCEGNLASQIARGRATIRGPTTGDLIRNHRTDYERRAILSEPNFSKRPLLKQPSELLLGKAN